jgi:hypothetical protein
MNKESAVSIVSGAILFIDLDKYLMLVREFDAAEEWAYVEPLHRTIEATALRYGFVLTRTFGDGFLLYRTADVGASLLSLSSSLVVALQSALGKQLISFKASLAGGDFLIAKRILSSGNEELVLCGPLVNFVGKKLGTLDQQSLFCSWPKDGEALRSLKFSVLDAPAADRTNLTCEVSDAHALACILIEAETPSMQAKPTQQLDSLPFTNAIKEFILETIKLADDKAKAVFAVSGALLVYLFNGGGWPRPDKLPNSSDIAELTRLVALCMAMFALIVSSLYSLAVLLPRMTTNFKGLVFFGSIAAWPSAKSYSDELARNDSTSLQRESAMHNYEISKVTLKKYKALNRSLVWMGLGVLATLIYLGISWWLQAAVPSK